MTTDVGRVAEATGLSQAEPSSTVSALAGFDPSRTQGAIDAAARDLNEDAEEAGSKVADEVIQTLGILPRDYMTKKAIQYAARMGALRGVQVAIRHAIAMEAATAGETVGLDPKDDSAGLKGIAQ